MDELHLRIVAVLQADGALTKAELAEAVGSTPSTCLRRVAELRRTGAESLCLSSGPGQTRAQHSGSHHCHYAQPH